MIRIPSCFKPTRVCASGAGLNRNKRRKWARRPRQNRHGTSEKIVEQIRCLLSSFRYDTGVLIVSRPKLSWFENLYLPGIFKGLVITARHFIDHMLGRRKVTMQYPEEKWP